jgi:hypothetical protein
MQHEQGDMFGNSENNRLDHVCLLRCGVMCSDHASRTKRSRVRTQGLDEPNPICSGVLAVIKLYWRLLVSSRGAVAD